MSETIFALSTPPGKSGVAVVRVSGPNAWKSLEALTPDQKLPDVKRASLRRIVDTVSRESIDRTLVIGFRTPASFTGEDCVEYHVHGSAAVIDSLLSALSTQQGHRPAQPGEFTRRAFENGKMDLTEAEAVADLIDAETQAQKQQAMAQMEGALSRLYDGWRDELVRSLAYVEAVIDFPDEEVPDDEIKKIFPAIEKLIAEVSGHLDDARRGERLRNGIQVAVIGTPNAGKSSLVNALAQRDVAIVSDLAGTTRDIIEVHLDLGGYPVILADTAGLRPEQLEDSGHEAIESEGIRRAIKRAEEADIRLLVFDGTAEKPDPHTLELINRDSVVIINKCDLFHVKHKSLAALQAIELSIETGKNLDKLLVSLEQRVKQLFLASRETPSLTRQRHRAALEECRSALKDSLKLSEPELMGEQMRLAVRALGRITGRVDVEDLLDVIFKDFCIGK